LAICHTTIFIRSNANTMVKIDFKKCITQSNIFYNKPIV